MEEILDSRDLYIDSDVLSAEERRRGKARVVELTEDDSSSTDGSTHLDGSTNKESKEEKKRKAGRKKEKSHHKRYSAQHPTKATASQTRSITRKPRLGPRGDEIPSPRRESYPSTMTPGIDSTVGREHHSSKEGQAQLQMSRHASDIAHGSAMAGTTTKPLWSFGNIFTSNLRRSKDKDRLEFSNVPS